MQERLEPLGRDELIQLVRRLCDADVASEAEADRIVKILEANVPHPAISDLIFWGDDNWTPEEIVDMALSYKPLALPPVTDKRRASE